MKILAANILFHFAAHQWMTHTITGQRFKKFCQEWRTDSVWELLSYGGLTFLYLVCAILGLGLTFRSLGI